MKSYSLIICLCLLLTKGILAQSTHKNDKDEIKAMLERQRTAWNNGDLKGYMQGYWQSDSLIFIGKSGVTYGWQNTLANYERAYPNKQAMGALTFTILKVQQLSPKYATVVGKWELSRTAGMLGGHFSLILQKKNKQWVIISDHSS